MPDPTNARSWDRGTSTLNNCRIARISSITEIFSPSVMVVRSFCFAKKKKIGVSCTLRPYFFAGDRASDLLGLKTVDIRRFPDNSGFLFNHV